MYDVIVAGGGPAGSSVAAHLVKRGHRVLVLEREKFPRFHVGESLLPFGSDFLRELGVLEEVDARYIHKPGARFIHEESGESFTFYFDQAIEPGRPYAYQVPRADFDQLLLDNARRLGAEVREETEVRDVRFHGDRVEVVTRASHAGAVAETHAAKMFLDATGRDALIATQENLKAPDDLITTNMACFTHYEDVVRQDGTDEGNFTAVLFDGGWWWFIPFKGRVTSIGVVFEKRYSLARKGMTPEEMFDHAVATQTQIKRILAPGRRVRPVATTGNWSYRSRVFHGDRWLLVGDAAAFIDPLFSTGVLMALAGGKFAAEAVDAALIDGDYRAARFASYQKRCTDGADRFKHLVYEFYGENLRKLLVRAARNSTMCSIITSLLAGDVYKNALWHGAIKQGFSHLEDVKMTSRRISPTEV